LKSILQSLPLAVVTFDSDLRITDANPQATSLIRLDEYIDRSLSAGTSTPTAAGLDWTETLNSIIVTGRTQSFESITYTLNGRTRTLRLVCTPLRKPDSDTVLGGTVILEDITEELNTQRKLNEQIDKPRDYLLRCREGLMRMVHILSELLEFSRTTYAPFERVRIDHIVEDAIKTMEPAAQASRIQILRTYAPDTPQISAGDLLQVFLNLTKNALDAMPSGGTLAVATRIAADSAAVEFHDSGIGFPPEHAQAIFEPFFTTKEKGKGTGLGLAICKDIIQKYQGRITAENAPGGGSIFTVYLPLTEQSL
jgi:PAS domain S-box-containing protein